MPACLLPLPATSRLLYSSLEGLFFTPPMRHWFWLQQIILPPTIPIFMVVGVLISARQTVAQPANVFAPYLDRIQQTLPPNYQMRLPAAILLGGPADQDLIENLKVRIFASDGTPGMVVGLYTCDDPSQFCLVGSFAVTSERSPTGLRLFATHLAGAAPVTLTPTVRAYLLEGQQQQPASGFSSLMWRQDGMLYRVQFAYPERQNILYMAKSMAENQPLISLNPQFREPPREGSR